MAMLVNRSTAKEETSRCAVREVQKVMASFKDGNFFEDVEVERIFPSLEELVERLRRLQALSDRFKNVALSPHIEAMIRRAGKGYLLGRLRA